MKIKATARVLVTLETTATGTWGADCPMTQVYDQAAENAIRALFATLKPTDWRVFGKAKVTAILTDEDKSE